MAAKDVIVPTTGQTPSVDFDLARFIGDYREARLMKPVILPNGAVIEVPVTASDPATFYRAVWVR